MGWTHCDCAIRPIPQIFPGVPISEQLRLDTEVVVIGNGPAGISLSAFLSGWHPCYNKNKPHPDPVVAERFLDNKIVGLIDQDLSWFQDECAERINPTVGAFPALYDTLVRPPFEEDQQLGMVNASDKTCLKWAWRPWRSVSHVVLGDGEIGGSWNGYDDDMVTVSLAHWMDLPGYSAAEWLGGKTMISRLPAAMIREYFRAYVIKMKIEANFHSFTKVTNVAKLCWEPTGEEYWEVRGICRGDRPFVIKCRKVVLACGRSHPKTLEVPGELNAAESQVVYDLASMKLLLSFSDVNSAEEEVQKFSVAPESIQASSSSFSFENSNQSKQVVVVGDGISAADAVLYCLENSVPVLQLVRRSEHQLRSVMISRLSSVVYPEYAKVFRLMMRREIDPNYRCLTSARVDSLDNKAEVVAIETPHGILKERFRCLVACVGRKSQLDMLEEKFEFLADYKTSTDNTIFAIGSLAGDHFVRYLIGGALQVAQTLIHEGDEQKWLAYRTRMMELYGEFDDDWPVPHLPPILFGCPEYE